MGRYCAVKDQDRGHSHKKIHCTALFSLSISLELLLIGIYLLLFSKRQTSGKVFVVFGFLLLVAAGHQIPSDKVLEPLESKYQPITDVQQQLPEEIRHIRWIVVLGGGHSINTNLPPTKRTSATSMERLVEGIRLYRMIPGSKLLLSGGSVYDSTSDALFMSDVAVSLGVDKHDIVLKTESKDTDDAGDRRYAVELQEGRSSECARPCPQIPICLAKRNRRSVPDPGNRPLLRGASHAVKDPKNAQI